MNIGYIAPVVYPFVKGGAEKRIHEVGRRLADRGHEVTIYSRHWWDGPRMTDHAGMTLQSIGPPTELYANGDRRSIKSALGLATRVLVKIKPREHDILATPVAPYFHVTAAKLAGAIRRTPLVVIWHEVWGDYWRQYIGQLGRIGSLVEHGIGRIPHHPVAPSEMTANRLAELGPAREKITVIPNGIDVAAIQNVPEVTEGFDILYAGRLIEDKNVDLLLDSFNRVSDDATMGIIGDGPMREALETQAAKLTCADRVDFLGFLDSYDDVLGHMRAAPTFVSPSVREGFGITLLEAMAADCTVIAVDHPHNASREVVGEAGFVTEPTVEAVAEALGQALAGAKPSRNPVVAAKAYDWEKIIGQIEAYYSEVIHQ